MERYHIEAYANGSVAYNVVVKTIEQAKQEMVDALNDGYQVLITKYITKGEKSA
jgi:hypothetical protein